MNHYEVKTLAASTSVACLLKLANSMMHQRMATELARHELTFMQWMVLMNLHECTSGLTTTDLARLMCHDTGALTRLLDNLKTRGYLVRERDRDDRRLVYVRLSATGCRKVRELAPLTVDALNGTLTTMSTAEFTEFTRLLRQIVHDLRLAAEVRNLATSDQVASEQPSAREAG